MRLYDREGTYQIDYTCPITGARRRKTTAIRVGYGESADTRRALKVQANEFFKDLQRAVLADKVANPDHLASRRADKFPNLAAFVTWYLSVKKWTHESTTTQNTKLLTGYLVPNLGKRRLSEIAPTDIETFIVEFIAARRAENPDLKNATLRHELATIRAVFTKAFDMNLIGRSPWHKIALPARDPLALPVLDEAECFAIFQALWRHDWRDATLFLLLLKTGQRVGAALELKWTDLHNNRVNYTVTKKKLLVSPEQPAAARPLLDRLRIESGHSPYVFAYLRLPSAKYRGRPLPLNPSPTQARKAAYQRFRRSFIVGCEDAGIPYGRAWGAITLHRASRATAITRMTEGNIHDSKIMDVVGMRDAVSLKPYKLIASNHLDSAQAQIAPDITEAKVAALLSTLATPSARS